MIDHRLSRRDMLVRGLALPVVIAGLSGTGRTGAVRTGAVQMGTGAGLVEPHMRLAAGDGRARVALTLDACDGLADRRILDMLIGARVAATVFVSGVWLRRNPDSFADLLAHPDLFEIGNHGARHRAAIEDAEVVWGVRAAGSAEAIAVEVGDGAAMLMAAGATKPAWYRGATALYSPGAMAGIVALGYRIAGFSLNGDQGAGLGAAATRARIKGAGDGEVIVAHINQPHRSAGAGVVAGVLALQAQGMGFVRLSDGPVAAVV